MAESYENRVSQQITQFADTGRLWRLPPIYSYWSNKYIIPRLESVSGYKSIINAYFSAIAEAARRKPLDRVVLYSIGAGDCSLEISLAERLRDELVMNAKIVCLELSAFRLDRARAQASKKNVISLMEFKVTDLNNWKPNEHVDVFIAHHTLHHLVELEKIFMSVYEAMSDDSVLITADMIGRNGHQRWPEALAWIKKLWKIMPAKYKLNFQFNSIHSEYIDWDCSTTGFEGIRAQDVLPALIHQFNCEWFLGYGGIIDPFIERGYGHNFNVQDDRDTGFIDLVEELNQYLLETHYLTPTIMLAAFRKAKVPCRFYANISPNNSIRKS